MLSLNNRIRIAYHQPDGLNTDNIDKTHPRLIDETGELPPVDINDAETGKKYLELFTSQIKEIQKEYDNIQKDIEKLPSLINDLIQVSNERIDTYNITADITHNQLKMMRLGYYAEQQNHIRILDDHLNRLFNYFTTPETDTGEDDEIEEEAGNGFESESNIETS